MTGVEAIGSDFDEVDPSLLVQDLSVPPWLGPRDSVGYFESGRQALTAVARALAQGRPRTIAVPTYFCESMLTPFLGAGWILRPLRVDAELVVDPDALASVDADWVLHAPYFGRADGSAVTEALRAVRERGIGIIADETHLVLTPASAGDIQVASLRKLLPLPDGAYVRSAAELRLSWPAPTSTAPSLRARAMRGKARAIATGADERRWRELFLTAEEITERALEPAPMSSTAHSLVSQLDYDALRRRRVANARTLITRLADVSGLAIVNPPATAAVPSHLVVALDRPRDAQRVLAEQQIFCPIHWPPSDLVGGAAQWPTRFLSLPVDHRYTPRHMDRIADVLSTHLQEHQ